MNLCEAQCAGYEEYECVDGKCVMEKVIMPNKQIVIVCESMNRYRYVVVQEKHTVTHVLQNAFRNLRYLYM